MRLQKYFFFTNSSNNGSVNLTYGMPVSILLLPETVWGYDKVTSAYEESPMASWQRIVDRIMSLHPDADKKDAMAMAGKKPDE